MDSASGTQMQNHIGYTEVSDDGLVKLCQSGDQVAFDELMRRHRDVGNENRSFHSA